MNVDFSMFMISGQCKPFKIAHSSRSVCESVHECSRPPQSLFSGSTPVIIVAYRHLEEKLVATCPHRPLPHEIDANGFKWKLLRNTWAAHTGQADMIRAWMRTSWRNWCPSCRIFSLSTGQEPEGVWSIYIYVWRGCGGCYMLGKGWLQFGV